MKQLINRDEMRLFLQRHCLKIHWNELKINERKVTWRPCQFCLTGSKQRLTDCHGSPAETSDWYDLTWRQVAEKILAFEWNWGMMTHRRSRRQHILLLPFPRRSGWWISSSKPAAGTWRHLSCCQLMLIYNCEVSRRRYPSVMRSC